MLPQIKTSLKKLIILSLLYFPLIIQASTLSDLQRLKTAYPEQIQSISEQYITWKDGTQMAVQISPANKSFQEKLENPTLADQIIHVHYPGEKAGFDKAAAQKTDPGRIRYLPFFQKMYGKNKAAVEKNLVTIYWMPNVFGKNHPLRVTTINNVDKKLQAISAELEKLPAAYHKFLANPGGTFLWRKIANTERVSAHSFGMTIDINSHYANYWQWDLKKAGQAVDEKSILNYQNQIPWEMVEIFEKHGFIWGGKWYHYDTMHFEYRPELLPSLS